MDAERDCVDSTRVDAVVPLPRPMAVSVSTEGARPWKEPHGCGDVLPEVQGRRPLNQWREVCRWDVEEQTKDQIADAFTKTELANIASETTWMLATLRDAFDSLIACYEELAGEHRELWEAFMRDAEALSTPCPGDPEDYTFVRAYYRPRRSKLAAIEPDHPTVQADPAAGEIDTLQGQGEARNADGTPYIVGESGVGSAIPQSGEERSE